MKKVVFPAPRAETEALRESLRRAIREEELEAVVGGNDDLKPDQGGFPCNWSCPYCGGVVRLKKCEDAAKHVVKCPNNPYK